MTDSFVDLSYRGLPLGRRIKLSQVRPSTGYLEMPTPMPVGTDIAIATDEGRTVEATVMAIHEQVGGSDRVPGMLVSPKLGDETVSAWWSARVALPDEVVTPALTVRPRTKTGEQSTAVRSSAPSSAASSSASSVPSSAVAATPMAAATAVSSSSAAVEAAPPSSLRDTDPEVPAPPVLPEGETATRRPAMGRAKTIMGTGPQTITADEPPPSVRTSRADSSGLMATMSADEPPVEERPSGGTGPVLAITADEPPPAVRASRADSSGLVRTIEIADTGESTEIVHPGTLAPSPATEASTTTMPAIDQELLERLSRNPEELAQLMNSSEHAVVDDGQRTTIMGAVDPSTLGIEDPSAAASSLRLEMTASGRFKSIEPGASGPRPRSDTSTDLDDDSTADGRPQLDESVAYRSSGAPVTMPPPFATTPAASASASASSSGSGSGSGSDGDADDDGDDDKPKSSSGGGTKKRRKKR